MQIVLAPSLSPDSPQYVKIAQRIEAKRPTLTRSLKLPSEYQLAREYGTGRDTLRRALGLLERSGAVTRQPGRGRGTYLLPHRILPTSARGSTIGFISPWWMNSLNEWFLTLTLDGVSKWTNEHDCRLSLMHVARFEEDEQKILDKLSACGVEGLIWVQPVPQQRKLLTALARQMPCVVIGREYEDADVHAVLPNYRQAAGLLDAHLVSQGHSTYSVVGRSPTDPYGSSWIKAFEEAQARRGGYFEELEYYINITPFHRDRIAELLLDHHFDIQIESQALVLTSSSWIPPLVASERFRDAVARQISFVAFDYGIQPTPSYWPGRRITHVTCDWKEIGRKAVETLFAVVEGKGVPRVVHQPVWLVEGDTVAPPAQKRSGSGWEEYHEGFKGRQ